MRIDMRRMWINQPSTAQPDHSMHGQRVLVAEENGKLVEDGDGIVRGFFVDGPVESARLFKLSLSDGWPKTSRP